MDEKIYLHYTKAELERNFDQRGWASNAEAIIARCVARSQATRERHRPRAALRYGPGATEILDIFLADRWPAPVLVFVHGGAWRNFSKDDFLYVAAGFVPAGFHTAILNFSNLPSVSLAEMIDQVRRGIEWVHGNAATFGGDPARIHVAAHSSGAHLAAMALVTDWAARDVPADVVKSAALVSGVYDLEPVMLSVRANYVRASKEEEWSLSPQHQAARIPCPVLVAYAEHDTDEFQRQSREFAAALERAERPVTFLRLAGLNHFEIMEQIGEPDGATVRAILEHMGAGTKGA